MSGNLKIKFKLKKPVGVKEDGNNQNAQCFEQVEVVPKNIGIRSFKSPLYKCANTIVQGKPQTQPEIGPFPDARYVLNKFQA